MSIDEKELAIIAVREAGAIKTRLRQVAGGFSFKGLKALWDAAPEVVKHVEEIGVRLPGADKMKLATEILCELVEVWWCPDWAIRKFAPGILEAALKALKHPFVEQKK